MRCVFEALTVVSWRRACACAEVLENAEDRLFVVENDPNVQVMALMVAPGAGVPGDFPRATWRWMVDGLLGKVPVMVLMVRAVPGASRRATLLRVGELIGCGCPSERLSLLRKYGERADCWMAEMLSAPGASPQATW